MTEQMVAHVAFEVLGATVVTYGGETIDLTPPWPRISLRQAIKDRSGVDYEDYGDAISLRAKMVQMGLAVDASMGRGKLIDELLSTYVEPNLKQPTFLIDYPVELSPLAKRKSENPAEVERFEAFAGGMEIANAFSNLMTPKTSEGDFLNNSRSALRETKRPMS